MDTFTLAADPTASVAILQTDEVAPVATSSGLQAQIDRGWGALLSYRDISVNDTLLRVTEIAPGSVAVAADIDYRAVVGARYCSVLADTPYQALSALAVTVTSDNQLALFVRDSGDWPHSYECVGGFVRARYSYTTVEDFIIARCERELGMLTVTQLSCLGSYQFTSIAEHMLVYRYDVADTAAILQQKYPTAVTIPICEVDATLEAGSVHSLPLHHPTAQVLRVLRQAGLLGQ